MSKGGIRSILEVRLPVFRPLWRRIALTAACGAWSGVEYLFGSPTWGSLVLAITAYLFWSFFLAFDPKDYEPPEKNS
jgi:hypothetical protein